MRGPVPDRGFLAEHIERWQRRGYGHAPLEPLLARYLPTDGQRWLQGPTWALATDYGAWLDEPSSFLGLRPERADVGLYAIDLAIELRTNGIEHSDGPEAADR